ncbi:MAG: RsmB/NOP family class I SAM-dependent RNA methyltransferase [Alphaproteobacteria bacterium]|nr:RsmB/NOP family class I SAM-dependent RNA methyltransferase [Alphaproteobacteria bacterium]
MKYSARIEAAIEVLAAIGVTDRPADRVLDRYLRDRRYIGGSDRAAITERVWGVLRRRARLDWWIKRAGAGIHKDARGRVLADLVLTDGLDVAAVVTLADGSDYAPESLSKEEIKALRYLVGKPLDHDDMPAPVRVECPVWLWPSMQAVFGDEVETAVRALGDGASFDLRVNTLAQASRDDVVASLVADGIPAEATRLSPLAIRLDRRRPVDRLALFKDGGIEVQDEGSQLAALLVDAKPGMTVVDYCAGAGGKALGLAACMANKGRLLLMDVSKGRLDRAATRLRRAGVHNAERRVLVEGDKSIKRLAGKADRVLIDAPCTGTGTWRRNPDAKWRYDATALAEITTTQRIILERAAALVKPGGRLIYVTCSVLAEENEAMVGGFLAETMAFTALPIGAVWAETVEAAGGAACPAPPEAPYLRLAPHREGTDGFFVAVLERVHAPG